MCLAPQVGINDLWGQRKIRCLGPIHTLAPIALDRRHPTRAAISPVLPTPRVNIGAATEQLEEELHLIGRAGAHCHRRGRARPSESPGHWRLRVPVPHSTEEDDANARCRHAACPTRDRPGTTRYARCRTTCTSVNVTLHALAAKTAGDLRKRATATSWCRRRRYDKMRRFLWGLRVFSDAICNLIRAITTARPRSRAPK